MERSGSEKREEEVSGKRIGNLEAGDTQKKSDQSRRGPDYLCRAEVAHSGASSMNVKHSCKKAASQPARLRPSLNMDQRSSHTGAPRRRPLSFLLGIDQ
jgi:hypothetical protein